MINNKIILLSLIAVPFTMVLGNSMLIPELPHLATVFQVSQLKIGLLISFFSLTGGLSIPILGYLSDKYNRKMILIVSLLIYGLGGIIAGTLALLKPASSYNYILASRIIQGFGAGGTYPVAIALVGDIYPPQQRSTTLGSLEAANALGKVVSPLLGSILVLLFWPGLFFIYGILTFPLALLIYYFIPDPRQLKPELNLKKYSQNLISIVHKNGYPLLIYLITASTVLFILFGVLSFLANFFATEYQIYGLSKALLLSIPILTMVITAYLAGLYLKKNNTHFKWLLISGLVIDAIALLTLPFLDGLVLYLVLISVLGIGNGIILTALNTIITSSAKEAHRGGITALYGSARFLGIALGPPSFNLLHQISTFTMFALPATLALTLALFSLLLIKNQSFSVQES